MAGGSTLRGRQSTPRVIDAADSAVIFELTDGSAKIDELIGLMQPLGLTEVSRTGVLSITRGAE